MKKIISILAVFFLALIIFTSCGDCKGHENFIRNGQIKQARKTGCKITEISVTYLGDCKYEVISETYDPFAEYGYGATIYSDCIYQWKNGDYIFCEQR